ncbi:mechanosensitive ion channel protein MscS [Amylibacter marinus]|uniref:Mechanosensitive ion channel protein MscS n=1 Tax=Amylibacter marinus TaxID=1475483 RepID=A0ABQ5VSJ2_9RHOB|nr:DUF3772 domain-containing protein [Amylibacter marinus]GLQ34154.1 mechanosensitive ion channel protein MscS [Amylibacter marinus]
MRSITRALLCAVFTGFLSASAIAQGTSIFNVDAFRTAATQIETAVEEARDSNETLEGYRSDLTAFRSASLSAQETYADRVASVRAQLDILGEEPTEAGVPETAEVKALRADLTGRLSEAQAPLIVTQEAFQRIENLIAEIDQIIRTRQSEALTSLGPSPLSPSLWPPAASAVGAYFSQLGGEVKNAFNSPIRTKRLAENAPIILLLLIIGGALVFPARNWVSRQMQISTDGIDQPRNAFSLFLMSTGLVICPMLGIYVITHAIELANIFAVRGNVLLGYIPQIALSLIVALWVARNLFAQGGPGARVLGVDQSKIIGGRRTCIGLGLVFALFYFSQAMNNSEKFSLEVSAVLTFPIIVLGAYGLYLIARKFRVYRQALHSDAMSAGDALSARIFRFANSLCLLVALVAPLVALIGYVNLGLLLVMSTLLSITLFTVLFLTYALFVGVIDWLAQPDSNESSPSTDVRAGGLYKSALGIVLVGVAMPLLAIVWGARVSDISDFWFAIKEGIDVGGTRLSFSDVLSFVIIFSIGYTVTRLLQAALRTAVLPNTGIDEAAQNSLVTGLGYIGIFLSALFAITSTGLDLSNLAIVAGALSVGIGFGLQAIVSNFVSGIILLIERPIKLGDWVEVGAVSGYVRKIAVRSTSIETFDKAVVIVPNADLIAGTVTNRTLTSTRGRVRVPIGVSYDCDPEAVRKVLLELIADHPLVLKHPAPSVFFMGFGADSLNFEMRGILRDVNSKLTVTSDMNFAIAARFAKEGFEIPFAQRDVRIKNLSELTRKNTD